MSAQASNIGTSVKHLRQAEGRRRYVVHGGAVCSKCLTNPPAPSRRYCKACEASWAREARARRATGNAGKV